MTKEQYIAIRTKRDFLYQYFIGNGGKDIGERKFSFLLGMWTQSYMLDTQAALREIVIFLDKKFGDK